MNALIFAQKLIARGAYIRNIQNARNFSNLATYMRTANKLLAINGIRLLSTEKKPIEEKKSQEKMLMDSSKIHARSAGSENYFAEDEELVGAYKPNRYFFIINCIIFGNIMLALICLKCFEEQKGNEIKRREIEYRSKIYSRSIENIKEKYSSIIASIRCN